MKIVTLIARILLGLAFLVFGLNGFLDFIPHPPMPDSPAKQFSDVLMASHYMVFISAVEVVCAILFLINRYVPLALTLLGPIVVNILLFHLFLAPAAIAPGLVVTLCWILVFVRHRAAFTGIFAARS
jgi:putative oxidoreductase